MLSAPRGLTARCKPDLTSAGPGTPRTPRSPSLVSCSSSSPRISRRRWDNTPHASPLLAEPSSPPSSPRTPPTSAERFASSSPAADCSSSLEGAQPAAAGKPVYDCVDVVTQSLAVNLTLEEYRQLTSSSGLQEQLASSASPAQQPGAAAAPTSLSHLTLTSADLESMGLCNHCRYPCYLSGFPACEASHYLQMWDSDAPLKPRGFDSATSMRLHGIADIAAVSNGGRANGRWKPDNQDNFLLQRTASALAATADSSPSGSSSSGEDLPAAAAIGVFDGHGRLGASAAAIVRQAMADRLAAMQPEEAAAAAAAGLHGAASLLDGCFSAAEEAMVESGRDFSKSGCTAVLALLDRDSVSVAWAGDSRAVLGVCDMGATLGSRDADGSLLASSSSLGSSGSSLSGASDSYDGYVQPLCAAVPLTEDHKPDKPAERERIECSGGRVTRLATDRFGNPAGPFRVFVPNCWSPGLALSRAFGDTLAGTVGVTSKPEVTVLPLPSPPSPAAPTEDLALSAVSNSAAASCCSSSSDGPGLAAAAASAQERHVLIVASDGLWEWVSNTTAVAIASAASCAEDAAHALVEAAQKQWAVRYRGRNCDDITVVVAFLDR